MMPTHSTIQAGFSLISALFLLVVIAALGTFATTLLVTQQHSIALNVQGVRAYHAARSGIEWGAFHLTQSAVAVPNFDFANKCRAVGGTSINYVLNAFTVTVSCQANSYVEPMIIDGVLRHDAANPLWIYQLSAVAVTTGIAVGDSNYVERQLNAAILQ